MGVTAVLINPRLSFRFSIEMAGIQVALVETLQRPKISVTIVEHSQGGVTHTTKTAGGMETFEDMTLNKVMPAEEEDNWAFEWLSKAVNMDTYTTHNPIDYKQDITVNQLKGNGDIIQSWTYTGCFIKEISYSEYDALDRAAKMIETVVISVDTMKVT